MLKNGTSYFDASTSKVEQASFWWALLNGGDATPAHDRAFGEWVARSPENIKAFLEITVLARALMSPGLHWPAMPAGTLVREANAALGNATDLPAGENETESFPS